MILDHVIFICLDREDRRRGYIGRDYGEDDDDIDYTKGMYHLVHQRGDQRKNAENLPKLYTGFSAFFLWSPLGNYEKKAQILRGFTKS